LQRMTGDRSRRTCGPFSSSPFNGFFLPLKFLARGPAAKLPTAGTEALFLEFPSFFKAPPLPGRARLVRQPSRENSGRAPRSSSSSFFPSSEPVNPFSVPQGLRTNSPFLFLFSVWLEVFSTPFTWEAFRPRQVEALWRSASALTLDFFSDFGLGADSCPDFASLMTKVWTSPPSSFFSPGLRTSAQRLRRRADLALHPFEDPSPSPPFCSF